MRRLVGILRRGRDALRLGGAVVLGPVSRRPVRPIRTEATQPLPADDLLPAAQEQWTHAITMRARPVDIWPWLAQLGCRRAGWYSYDGLDNGGVRSADHVIAELQHPKVGDLFAWTPTAQDGFIVGHFEPERVLVLRGDAGSLYRVTWTFVLQPLDDAHTRLITRSRGEYLNATGRLRLELAMHPIHFAMQRRQLLNLRRRIEHATASPPGSTSVS